MLKETMTENERHYYMRGAEDAVKFCANQLEIYQDVLKAETAYYKLHLGYDDVEGSYDLRVTFKSIFTRVRAVSISYSDAKEAIERAIRFIAEHPAPRAVCYADY